MSDKFSFAVGRPWDINKPDGSIGFYTYGSTIFHGTMDEAKEFRDYAERQSDFDPKRGHYRIYKIVEVEE